ncbi:hypothetical protein BaRGS_00011320 [Batillaria attramentaria]|uniref:Uncharacterized protein n=1 Tax=Batillaria attramentaria TaxID=370345 RepID=A0ABD0LE22_9CAEN
MAGVKRRSILKPQPRGLNQFRAPAETKRGTKGPESGHGFSRNGEGRVAELRTESMLLCSVRPPSHGLTSGVN